MLLFCGQRAETCLSGKNTRFARSETWVQIPEKAIVVTGRASELNSLLTIDKVSVLT